jgi:ubiquinone/menaquinone biosynthesis C-methylase UbiE
MATEIRNKSAQKTSQTGVSGLSANACLAVSKLFLNGSLKRFGFRKEEITRFDTMENWVADRVEQIEEYEQLFRPFTSFAGKTVLDLGCNKGYLLNSFLQKEDFTAVGADINAEALVTGRETFGDKIKFVQSTADSIPLPDESVDIIYTIDTVEHLSQPEKTFAECHRILRPGGVLFIHFQGFYGPYGSHLEDIIPFPWASAVFSMDTLLEVAAHLYESPDYRVACYYVDEQTGEKKANPYLDKARWREFLNHITIRRFRNIVKKTPFQILRLENIGFGGKTFRFGRYLGKLSQMPIAEEYFTKATFCVLKK